MIVIPLGLCILGPLTTEYSSLPEYLTLKILITLFFVAPAEEILFRNLVQEYLYKHTTTLFTLIAGTLIFIFSHTPSVIFTDSGFPVAGAIGLTLLYHETRSLPVLIIFHGCLNSTIYIALYYFI